MSSNYRLIHNKGIKSLKSHLKKLDLTILF
jgi:hypothetical protein